MTTVSKIFVGAAILLALLILLILFKIAIDPLPTLNVSKTPLELTLCQETVKRLKKKNELQKRIIGFLDRHTRPLDSPYTKPRPQK